MATEPGTNAYRDRPGCCPQHSRPAPRSGAAGVRMSVGCGSSAALGPGVAPVADSKPGRRGRALPTAAVTSEKRRQEECRSPWPWKLFSLDFESLMRVRRPPAFRVNSRPVLGETVLGPSEVAGALILYGFRAGDHSSTLAS